MPAEPSFRYRNSLSAETRHGERRVVRAKSRPRKKLLVTVVVILLLVPAGLLALRSLYDALDGGSPDPETVAERTRASAPSPTLDANDPFGGTPAENYAIGPDGITMPTVTPLGTWTAAQVQDVLDRTEEALVTGRLDQMVLLERDPSKYLALLSPSVRTATGKEIAKGTAALGYVTRLAPGYTLVAQVRTKGAVTVGLGTDKQLVVKADVVWVYPLHGQVDNDLAKGAGAKLVVLHTVETYQWFPTKGYSKQDQGLRPGAGDQGLYNMDCELSQQGLLALPRTAPGETPPSAGDSRAFDPGTDPAKFPVTC
jgi:hypothetical protein